MRMRKLIICLVAGMMMVLSTLQASADESLVLTLNSKGVFEYNKDAKEGLVEFGNNFSKMLPGETRTATMTLQNDCNTADFYISTETIDAFETANATNGAYDLKLVVGNNTIYDSSLGGYTISRDANGNEGLKELNDSLQGYVYAVTLDKGKSADVLFSLTLDGESVTNSYMSTDAIIHFDYQAVYDTKGVRIVTDEAKQEVVQNPSSVQYVKSGNVTIVDEQTATSGTFAAKTGDTYEMILYGVLFLVALLVCVFTFRKKTQKEV